MASTASIHEKDLSHVKTKSTTVSFASGSVLGPQEGAGEGLTCLRLSHHGAFLLSPAREDMVQLPSSSCRPKELLKPENTSPIPCRCLQLALITATATVSAARPVTGTHPSRPHTRHFSFLPLNGPAALRGRPHSPPSPRGSLQRQVFHPK